MIHITHAHINRTLCGKPTRPGQDAWLITRAEYYRRRAVEGLRQPVCRTCCRKAEGQTVQLRAA